MIALSSPRIVGTNRADFFDIHTFLQFKEFKGKSGEELVLAIYDYLTDTIDGSYHYWPMDDLVETPEIRGYSTDPIKILNTFGWAVCGQMAAILYAIYTAAGLPARVYSIPGHTLCEVFYDNSWHHLDVDMWTWFKNDAGHIASAYELSQDTNRLCL